MSEKSKQILKFALLSSANSSSLVLCYQSLELQVANLTKNEKLFMSLDMSKDIKSFSFFVEFAWKDKIYNLQW